MSKCKADTYYEACTNAWPYADPHAIALWCVLEMEGYVRHRQHMEALALLVSQQLGRPLAA